MLLSTFDIEAFDPPAQAVHSGSVRPGSAGTAGTGGNDRQIQM